MYYAHRVNEKIVLDKKINGVFGQFNDCFEIIKHYSNHVLNWDDEKISFTEDYFRQISDHKKGYYEFLVENKHIFIFENEPTAEDIQNINNIIK